MKTFEEYLSEQFWKQYNGLDDEAPEATQDWLAELEPQDFIDYGQSWVKEYYNNKVQSMIDDAYLRGCRELNKDKKESLIDISENKEDEPDNNINSYEHEEHCGDS